ncbi:YraN family protein [Ancylobacter sonchi]|uniref:YraN family protein n=1 Tax=Ancylobacter sonchi TaxID=1937790 RepID=UPI001BD3A1A6|nr:YraN family protein [Ancylobacter sonchi]MBS7533694.1 YraN family protein [Ancylobacter sonchi]
MTVPKPTAFSRGVAAEETAARLLAEQGFAILARRVRTPRGEIDLIARREDLLLFVEVKARSGLRAAAESVLVRQRRRIAAAAEVWLAAHPEFAALDMRLDVVLLAPGRAPVHLPGAFEAD